MIRLKKLTHQDGQDIFNMLKGIKAVENSYTNPVYDMSFAEFQQWLVQQERWARGEGLPDGYVAQSIYWMFDDDIPVGVGKIRHELTQESRITGGNIGYAISYLYRGNGYGTKLLGLLLEKAREMGITEILLTVDRNNRPSKRVCEENGGTLSAENVERWYFIF